MRILIAVLVLTLGLWLTLSEAQTLADRGMVVRLDGKIFINQRE